MILVCFDVKKVKKAVRHLGGLEGRLQDPKSTPFKFRVLVFFLDFTDTLKKFSSCNFASSQLSTCAQVSPELRKSRASPRKCL